MDTIEPFLEDLFIEINKVNIDLTGKKIDHIAYRTESTKEYEDM